MTSNMPRRISLRLVRTYDRQPSESRTLVHQRVSSTVNGINDWQYGFYFLFLFSFRGILPGGRTYIFLIRNAGALIHRLL